MAEIVGRDAELREADAFLDATASGRAALRLEGEAGIGKSTIGTAITARAATRGFTVLSSRPAAAEAALTLAALADLLMPVPAAILDGLPAPQRRAIDAALLRGDPSGGPLEQRLLGTAVRSVLATLAETAPVLISIDDVQWLDPPSAATLTFALRRLAGVRIGVLATRRAGHPLPLHDDALAPPDRTRTVRVGPLSVAALHHVLKSRLGRSPSRTTLVRVHEASRGNALFALEIVRVLDEVGEPRADQPLPVPRDIDDLVRRRIALLPGSTREVLLVASAMGHPQADAVRTALGRDITSDLETAERDGIARLEAGLVRFDHPLFARGIYGRASAAQRRDVHRRLAGAVGGVEARARHRALAADGPDREVAADLEAAASAADARGAPSAAAALVELAIQLTPPGDTTARAGRGTALGGYLQRSGDPTRARRVLEAVIESLGPGRARARARIALTTLLFEADAGPGAARQAEEAISDADGDPELEAFAHAVFAAVAYDDRASGIGHAREARRLLDSVADPDPRVASLVLLQHIGAEIDVGAPLPMDEIERALELERIAPMPNVGDRVSAALGAILKQEGDYDGARRWLEATYASAVEEGDEGSLAYAISHLPTLELAVGRWARAEEMAHRHLEIATSLGLESQCLQALLNLALVHVHQGRESDARAEIAELIAGAERAGDRFDLANGLGTLGVLELALGQAGEAADHLSQAARIRDEIGDARPRRQDADLVESLVAIGDIDGARAALADIDRRARRHGRPAHLAQAARARGLVAAASGDLDDAACALEEALSEHERAPIPFERARTQLALGMVRRRRRERGAAKLAIEGALATFATLGASLWAERARRELDRVGVRRASDGLTEGERRVAELAATGRTNREVAAALFLSPKTVEANLARAYHKLGVRSRAELGAVMATSGARGDPLQT